MFVLRTQIATIFEPKVTAICALYTNKQNWETLQGYIFRTLQHFVTELYIFTILLFYYVLSSCGDWLHSLCLDQNLLCNVNCSL